ncbi:MAG: hypothetical protein IJZ64_09135 [Ruminococcus sp.]|nr:hypothetical protein [Ruminococcus sp.]
MSTKEMLYSEINNLTEDQMKGLLLFIRGFYKIENNETLSAIKEVEDMKKNPDKYKGYTDVDEMMRDLLQ